VLWEGFVAAGLERNSLVAALGGGVVGDLAGFAAATFLRGVPWVVLPTTLLAMCDSAIGGKTGADLPQGKNLIGAFHSPSLVLADPVALSTLPPAEIRSGLAEVVKAGLIDDEALFALCESGYDRVQSNWPEVISRAAAVKVKVIQEDPYEKGRRAVLNLGHTIGHAVEWASGYQLKHGEAVAIGMVVEARLAEEISLADTGLAERVAGVLRALGLPAALPAGMPVEQILSGIKVDKKRRQGQVHFALPAKVGDVRHDIMIEEERICQLLAQNPEIT
jgi:3-dehydroquinate synthase